MYDDTANPSSPRSWGCSRSTELRLHRLGEGEGWRRQRALQGGGSSTLLALRVALTRLQSQWLPIPPDAHSAAPRWVPARGAVPTAPQLFHLRAALADWLSAQTAHPVGYARGGESLASAKGRVFMAPPGRHLAVRSGSLWLSSEPERYSCRPSVDVLFESLAAECPREVVACLLTGMGRDGAEGLLALRRAGAHTIAQDEASSVIYGMPREAALLGAAERILPLGEIGAAVTRTTATGSR